VSVLSGDGKIRIGPDAGIDNQGTNGISIGKGAGQTDQGSSGVSIGFHAGQTNQVDHGIAIGSRAGETDQGQFSVAIGFRSSNISGGDFSIAIGSSAGMHGLGANSIAIGHNSDNTTATKSVGSIVLNASGSSTVAAGDHTCVIKPVRFGNPDTTSNILTWDHSSGEIVASALLSDPIVYSRNANKALTAVTASDPSTRKYPGPGLDASDYDAIFPFNWSGGNFCGYKISFLFQSDDTNDATLGLRFLSAGGHVMKGGEGEDYEYTNYGSGSSTASILFSNKVSQRTTFIELTLAKAGKKIVINGTNGTPTTTTSEDLEVFQTIGIFKRTDDADILNEVHGLGFWWDGGVPQSNVLNIGHFSVRGMMTRGINY
jgi:hypothetical protein